MFIYDGKRLVKIEMYDYIVTDSGRVWNWQDDFSEDLLINLDQWPEFDPKMQAYIVPDVAEVIDLAEYVEEIDEGTAVICEYDPETGDMLPRLEEIEAC